MGVSGDFWNGCVWRHLKWVCLETFGMGVSGDI